MDKLLMPLKRCSVASGKADRILGCVYKHSDYKSKEEIAHLQITE